MRCNAESHYNSITVANTYRSEDDIHYNTLGNYTASQISQQILYTDDTTLKRL